MRTECINWAGAKAALILASDNLDRAIAAADVALPTFDAENEELYAITAHSEAEFALLTSPAPDIDALLYKAGIPAAIERSPDEIALISADMRRLLCARSLV